MDTLTLEKARPRRRPVPVTLVIIAANFAMLFVCAVLPSVREKLLFDGGLVWQGEFWRVFTYAWIHAGFRHCLGNMVVLVLFAAYIEARWGRGRLALAYVGACIGSGVFLALVSPIVDQAVVGASGAVAGLVMLWMLALVTRQGKRWYVMLPELGLGVLVGIYFVGRMVLGDVLHLFVPDGVSHWGHVGGFLSGFVLFRLRVLPRDRRSEAGVRVDDPVSGPSA